MRTRFGLLVLLGLLTACDDDRTLLTPIAAGVTRGSAQIDIYGKWVAENDVLGRQPLRWTYRVEFIRAGAKVYDDGSTDGGTLQPLDAGTVTFAVSGQAVMTTASSVTPDARGDASVTLEANPPPRQGSGTLTATVTYSDGTGSDDTSFEVDLDQ